MQCLVFRRLVCHLSTFQLIWFLAPLILCRAQVVTQDVRGLLNTPASLRCSLKNPQEVLIVTWQKIKAVSPENMITYSENHGVVVQPAYKDKINITQLGLMNSTITFWNTTLEDEACYKCLFNTFGSGKISGIACLTLFVQPTVFLHYKLSEDHLNITCSANARPAPMISWKVFGSGIENSTEIVSHPNGTTSVTSILQIKDPKTQVGKDVICQVLHLGTVTDYRETVNKGFWFSVPLLLSIVSLVILLVLISILLYWKRHRNQDRACQDSCLENPMDGGAWWAAVHGVTKSRTRLSDFFHFSLSCIGEGNGNPLQCSCLENPRDGGAWWAAVYGSCTESDTTEAT